MPDCDRAKLKFCPADSPTQSSAVSRPGPWLKGVPTQLSVTFRLRTWCELERRCWRRSRPVWTARKVKKKVSGLGQRTRACHRRPGPQPRLKKQARQRQWQGLGPWQWPRWPCPGTHERRRADGRDSTVEPMEETLEEEMRHRHITQTSRIGHTTGHHHDRDQDHVDVADMTTVH